MSMSLEQVKEEAAKLSDAERAALVHSLLQSLDETVDTDPNEIEQAWLREIERRSAEIDRGEVQMIPGDESVARLRQRLG